MNPAPSVVAAVLGAGLAQRFGSGKLEAELHGQPLGLWPIRSAQALGIPVVCVAGPQQPSFLAGSGAQVIVNSDPARGLGSSIALAAAHARALEAGRLLVMLGDMPFVSTGTLQKLIDSTPTGGATACRYGDGSLGPPACFGAGLFAELETLAGDRGARGLLRDAVVLDVAARELLDVDTAAQLAALNRQPPAE